MKKLITKLSAFLFLVLLANPVMAETNSDTINLFESIDNLNQLSSYRLYQNFGGELKVNPTFGSPEAIEANFNIFVETDTENTQPYEANAYSKMRFVLNLRAEGENQPFKELNFIARVEAKSFFGDDIYLRLMGFNVHAVGVPEDEMASYEDFQQGVDTFIEPIKGRWIEIPMQKFYDELASESEVKELGFLTNPQDLALQLREEGMEKTYKKMIELMLDQFASSGEMNEEELKMANELIDEFLGSQFFTQKVLQAGEYAGQYSFNINRSRVYNFLIEMAQRYGQELSLLDKIELKAILEKFYISGRYQLNSEHRLYDDFYVRLSLRNIEELENFHLKYEQKVDHINANYSIEKPENFTSIEELMQNPALAPLGIFSATDVEEDYYFDEEDMSSDY